MEGNKVKGGREWREELGAFYAEAECGHTSIYHIQPKLRIRNYRFGSRKWSIDRAGEKHQGSYSRRGPCNQGVMLYGGY